MGDRYRVWSQLAGLSGISTAANTTDDTDYSGISWQGTKVGAIEGARDVDDRRHIISVLYCTVPPCCCFRAHDSSDYPVPNMEGSLK